MKTTFQSNTTIMDDNGNPVDGCFVLLFMTSAEAAALRDAKLARDGADLLAADAKPVAESIASSIIDWQQG